MIIVYCLSAAPKPDDIKHIHRRVAQLSDEFESSLPQFLNDYTQANLETFVRDPKRIMAASHAEHARAFSNWETSCVPSNCLTETAVRLYPRDVIQYREGRGSLRGATGWRLGPERKGDFVR
jgi:hypothetical protein